MNMNHAEKEVIKQFKSDKFVQNKGTEIVDENVAKLSSYKLTATPRGRFHEDEVLVSLKMSSTGGSITVKSDYFLEDVFENKYPSTLSSVGGRKLTIMFESTNYPSADVEPYNRQGAFYCPMSFDRLGEPITTQSWKVYAIDDRCSGEHISIEEPGINFGYIYGSIFVDETKLTDFIKDTLSACNYLTEEVTEILNAIKQLSVGKSFTRFF